MSNKILSITELINTNIYDSVFIKEKRRKMIELRKERIVSTMQLLK